MVHRKADLISSCCAVVQVKNPPTNTNSGKEASIERCYVVFKGKKFAGMDHFHYGSLSCVGLVLTSISHIYFSFAEPVLETLLFFPCYFYQVSFTINVKIFYAQ